MPSNKSMPKPRLQITSAFALAGMAMSSFAPLMSVEPQHPSWWSNRNVTNGNPPKNKAVATVAQVKHISTQAKAELDSLLPGGAGLTLPFPDKPQNADAAWYQKQKNALTLGELKACAYSVYQTLNAIDPGWVQSQLQLNGLNTLGVNYHRDSNGYYYPWNPQTAVSENRKVAILAQLKVTFCLRFNENLDGDTLTDLVELAMYGSTAGDGTTSDYDGDGLTDALEITHGTSLTEMDSDHDGVSDGDEVAASTDPLAAATTSSSASTLEVFTPLN